ncbi:MAG: glycosyltransferase family 117 protein [Candidatus Promineifilaceae bacterium]
MPGPRFQLPSSLSATARPLPGLAAGIYFGRLLAEWLRPGLLGTLGLTLLAAAAGAWFIRRRSLRQTWPLILLAGYVLYPEMELLAAAGAALWALLTFALWRSATRASGAKGGRYPRRLLAAALLTGLLGLGVYLVTLARGVLPADSGEFQLVAARLGVAHPPGFPLYTLLAHAMTWLPIGPTPAVRVNLFSALTAGAALSLVFLSAYRLHPSLASAALSCLALASATTFWAQATTANIRMLTALFTVLIVHEALVLPARREDQSPSANGPALWTGSPARLALFMVLGVAHHPSLLFTCLVVVAYAALYHRPLLRRPGQVGRILISAAAGLLPLLYLPWRGAAGAYGAPADLATWSGFWNHVLARGFRGDLFYFVRPTELVPRLGVMLEVLAFEFRPFLLAGMAAGFLWLAWQRRPVGFLLGLGFSLHLLVAATYRAPQTVEYMLPALVLAALSLPAAAGWLRTPRPGPAQAAGSAILAMFLVAALWQGWLRWPSFRWLAQDADTRLTLKGMLAAAPEASLVLADWHWATPLWYLQELEGFRPDLRVEYVFPTAEPYAETWRRRISEGLAAGETVLATHHDEMAYASLPTPRPAGEGFLFGAPGLEELPAGYEPLGVLLGDGVRLLGYYLEANDLAQTAEAVVQLAWAPGPAFKAETELFVQLLTTDGRLAAGEQQPARPQEGGVSLSQFRLTPGPAAVPGPAELVAGAVVAGQRLPDTRRRDLIPLASVTATPGAWRPVSAHRLSRPLVANPAQSLVGYDWDTTLPGRSRLYLHWRTPAGYWSQALDVSGAPHLPEPWLGPWAIPRRTAIPLDARQDYVPLGQGIVWTGGRANGFGAAPGAAVSLPQHFASSRPVLRDLIVSVRLVGLEDGAGWAWSELDDGVPALGAIPTLKWIAGSSPRDLHRLRLPAEARPGEELAVLVRLYDAFTGRALPILDSGIASQLPAIPAGGGAVAPVED